MDQSELKLRSAARKLKKSDSLARSMPSLQLPLRKQAPEKHALDLLTESLSEDPRAAEDLVQSLVLPVNS